MLANIGSLEHAPISEFVNPQLGGSRRVRIAVPRGGSFVILLTAGCPAG
jgi:hypothetical protein